MPQNPGRAIAYSVLIWMVGFVWGSIVFMTPALKSLRSIPYVSRYPAISFPLLIVWVVLAFVLTGNYLKTTSNRANEGLKLGLMFAVVNLILDLLVLVLLFKNGLAYFASLTVWLAYFILFAVPWFTGRSLAYSDTP